MASRAWVLPLLLLLTRPGATAAKELLKGISYGPAPLKKAGKLPNDDFMSTSAKAQWSTSGRGDLHIIKRLGANAVRLYGNDPREDHTPFLDEAVVQDLQVIPGMSDYPYTQMPKNCMTTDFNCYSQIKEQYKSMLQNGFAKDGAYHGALKTIIVINEPDLKIPGISKPTEFCRAIVSAIDGMIDAEKETDTKSNLINFTATFSFGQCTACKGSSKPALGQMMELPSAMEKPEDVGYQANNNLAEVYKTRFTNSFNTANPANDMKPLFLNDYEANFDSTPVFIGEYHSTHVSTKKDIHDVIEVAKNSDALVGVSFFEFQVRYDKGGTEMDFGMFGLGQISLAEMNFFGVEFPVWCLMKIQDAKDPGNTIADSLTVGFEGEGIPDDQLCVIDPKKVPLSEDGYQAILSTKSVNKMADFVRRVIWHMGGDVEDDKALVNFATKYAKQSLEVTVRRLSGLSFASMVDELGQHPSWVLWDAMAACVADRSADQDTVGEAIGWTCGNFRSFNCSDLPSFCSEDVWAHADYVFSLYFAVETDHSSPLEHCNFGGAAMFAPSKVYRSQDSACIVTKDPATTALSEEGYQMILQFHDTDKAAVFIQREVEDLKMKVANKSALTNFAMKPPAHFKDLKEQLPQVPWVCGGPSGRNCRFPLNPTDGGGGGWVVGLIICIVLLFAAILAALYVRRKRQMAAREVEQPLSEA